MNQCLTVDNRERRARLDFDAKLGILKQVLTVKPIRKIAEAQGCSNDAVRKFLREVGEAACEYNKLQKPLPIKNIQIDECYVIVGGRDDRVSDYMKTTAGWGHYWVWVAICADTGFIIATHVGGKGADDAIEIMRAIREKLPHNEDGSLVHKPDIVTDGLAAYYEAAQEVFGDECRFDQFYKKAVVKGKDGREYSGLDRHGNLKKGAKFKIGVPIRRIGKMPFEKIRTDRVEATMSRFRRRLPRFNRRSAFNSQSVARLEDAISLVVFAFNYILLRENKEPVFDKHGHPEKTASGRQKMQTWHKPPPAVELKLAEHPSTRFCRASLPQVWSEKGLVRLTEAFVFRRDVERAQERAREARLSTSPFHTFGGLSTRVNPDEFYVMHQKRERRAVVHKGSCFHAASAGAKAGKTNDVIEWFGHGDKESALRHAYRLEPNDTAECKKCCVGRYNRLGRRL